MTKLIYYWYKKNMLDSNLLFKLLYLLNQRTFHLYMKKYCKKNLHYIILQKSENIFEKKSGNQSCKWKILLKKVLLV